MLRRRYRLLHRFAPLCPPPLYSPLAGDRVGAATGRGAQIREVDASQVKDALAIRIDWTSGESFRGLPCGGYV